jgi:hypothetical protein
LPLLRSASLCPARLRPKIWPASARPSIYFRRTTKYASAASTIPRCPVSPASSRRPARAGGASRSGLMRILRTSRSRAVKPDRSPPISPSCPRGRKPSARRPASFQEDAHLSHSRCAKKYHRVSRRQLEDHRGLARERGQCRAHYVVAKITIRASLAYSLMFSATAARMSALNALSSILSPSWKSMARLTCLSRLELNRPEGSLSDAPLAKVSFTTAL